MGRRTLLLIASILVAAVGTALIFLYVRGADDRANANTDRILVVVASKDISLGQTVDSANNATSFDVKPIERGSLPASGFYSGDNGFLKLTARKTATARRDIPSGSIITESDFTGEGQQSSASLAKNQVEVSLEITDPNRVAGVLAPGATVAVIVTTDPTSIKELGLSPADAKLLGVDPASDAKRTIVAALMSDIKVLRVGATGESADEGTGEAVDNKIVALALTPSQALTLRAGEKVGELSLAILGPDTKFDVGKNFPLIKSFPAPAS